jgi:hypothetical protein
VIKTDNLRKFLARRRWQRCGQAIRAMKRMSGKETRIINIIGLQRHQLRRAPVFRTTTGEGLAAAPSAQKSACF